MLKPKLVGIKDKILAGKSAQMSLAKDGTQELWQSFGPKVKEVSHKRNHLLYSVNIYPSAFVEGNHTVDTQFTKWAAVEVGQFKEEHNLEEFHIPAGDYAVFTHKGIANEFPKTLAFIYNEWLPNSEYQLADRPHFEVLTPNYQPNDPEHEEEIWIPIKKV